MRAVLAATAALLLLPAAAYAGLSPLLPCGDEMRCATLTVPLDRTGGDPGTLRLPVAVEATYRPGRDRLLIALTGGPGQPGVPFARGLADSMRPLLARGERLAVIDQRGTGREGALRCDGLQRLRGLDAFLPEAVGACGARLGAHARHLATADTVADLEALRAGLRAERVSLFGISYGTYVAQQYARTHPDRVRRLVLDSVLEPGGWDGFLLRNYQALPRVLRELCGGGRCRGVTRDPVADLAVVARRLAAGPLSARIPDARGRVRRAELRDGEELLFLLLAADLNDGLQSLLPAALRAAASGDPAPLARLREPGQGARLRSTDLSAAVLVATDCADAQLPYELSDPPAARRAKVNAALAALDPRAHAPFAATAVRSASLADDCLAWPVQPRAASAAGAMPDVPVLVLSGRLDLRTPLEGARGAAAQFPRATVVAVPGVGHDVLGYDPSGCAARALDRWARGRRVGNPCRRAVTPAVAASAPRRGPRTLAGARRAVRATADDVTDMVRALEGSGLRPRGGGLRAGWFSRATDGSAVRLKSYAFVPGVRLSGILRSDRSSRLRVTGTYRGTVRLELSGRVRGRLTRSSRSTR